MVQNNIERALRLLFARRPLPEQWVLSRKEAPLAAGFKLMAHQLQALRSEAGFWSYLVEHQVRVVLVLRHNILMQHVSDLITQETRQPACWDGNVKTARIVVPVDTLASALRRIMAEKQYLLRSVEQFGLERRRLRYEEFQNSVEPVEACFEWLTGERRALTTKLSKQNPNSLRARVQNYGELAAAATQLGFGHLLEE